MCPMTGDGNGGLGDFCCLDPTRALAWNHGRVLDGHASLSLLTCCPGEPLLKLSSGFAGRFLCADDPVWAHIDMD